MSLGYMLASHKAELGNMYVWNVVVFMGSYQAQFPCLLFRVLPLAAGRSAREVDPHDDLPEVMPDYLSEALANFTQPEAGYDFEGSAPSSGRQRVHVLRNNAK